MESEVVVIGGGISGLCAAVTLHQKNVPVQLFESNETVGGAAQTVLKDGFLCELGANTLMAARPEVFNFLDEQGLLSAALDAAPQAKKRFVVQKGKLQPLPVSLTQLISTPVLSFSSKLNLLIDFFRSPGSDPNESMAYFFQRRIGTEAVRELVDPFVSGIYAGDPKKLLIRHTMPRVYEWERNQGGLIRGFLNQPKTSSPKRRLISWPGGLSELTQSLATHLGNSVHTQTTVQRIERHESGFRIHAANLSCECRYLILAVPAWETARLLEPMAPKASILKEVHYASMSVVHLGFSREKVGHPLDGFGVLMSRARGIRTLGALFSSTLFPKRAPAGQVLLKALVGGETDPKALSLPDSDLISTVMDDLTPLLSLSGQPNFVHIMRWPRAIPQYDLKQDQHLAICNEIENKIPNLSLIGNYRGGVSLSDCMVNGIEAANRFNFWRSQEAEPNNF